MSRSSERDTAELWRRVQRLLRRYAQVAIVETEDEGDYIIVAASYLLPRDGVRMYCDRNTRLGDIEWEFGG